MAISSQRKKSPFEILAEINRAKEENQSTSRKLERLPSADLIDAHERNTTRTKTATNLVACYVVVICMAVVYIIFTHSKPEDFQAGWAALYDLIKTAILPVITFVIGHYFGSGK